MSIIKRNLVFDYKDNDYKLMEEKVKFKIIQAIPFKNPKQIEYSTSLKNEKFIIDHTNLEEKNKIFPKKDNFEFLVNHYIEGAKFLLNM